KLPALTRRGDVVVDIGAGCSDVAHGLRARCAERGHELILVESPEMLAHHADAPGVVKVAGRFPTETEELVRERADQAGAVIAYSVIQYAFTDASIFDFADAALALLAPGGRLLL